MSVSPQIDQEDLVRRWNCRWPAGGQVCVEKEICRGETTGPAFLKDGEAVVMVEGLCGPVPLSAVRPFPFASGPIALDLRLGLASQKERSGPPRGRWRLASRAQGTSWRRKP